MKNKLKDALPKQPTLNGVYRGVIEDNDDPEKMGRCRVRIFGIHSEEKAQKDFDGVPTEHLLWAEPVTPLFGGSSGLGVSSVPVKGSMVTLYFDGGNIMRPMMFGTTVGKPSEKAKPQKGFNDPDGVYPLENRLDEPELHRLARDNFEDTAIEYREDKRDLNVSLPGWRGDEEKKWDEPIPYYKKTENKHPHNAVLSAPGGIVIEIDSNPEEPRLHIYHPSNTFIEIDKEGNMIFRNEGDRFEITIKSKNIHVKGDLNQTVDGGKNDVVKGSEVRDIAGSQTEGVTGNVDVAVGGNTTHVTSGNTVVRAAEIHLNP